MEVNSTTFLNTSNIKQAHSEKKKLVVINLYNIPITTLLCKNNFGNLLHRSRPNRLKDNDESSFYVQACYLTNRKI